MKVVWVGLSGGERGGGVGGREEEENVSKKAVNVRGSFACKLIPDVPSSRAHRSLAPRRAGPRAFRGKGERKHSPPVGLQDHPGLAPAPAAQRIVKHPEGPPERDQHRSRSLPRRPGVRGDAGGHHPKPLPPQLLLRGEVVLGAAPARGLEQLQGLPGPDVRRVQLPGEGGRVGGEEVGHPYHPPPGVEPYGGGGGGSGPGEGGHVAALNWGRGIQARLLGGLGEGGRPRSCHGEGGGRSASCGVGGGGLGGRVLAAAPGEGKGGARRRLGEVECGRNGGGGGDCEEEKGDKDGSGRNDLHARGLAEIVMYVSSYSFSGDSRLRSSREEESESGVRPNV